MRTSILAVALASALLIVGAGGALAATDSLQPQQSTTSTGSTTTGGGATTAGASTTTGGSTTNTSVGTAASSGASVTFDDQQSSGETVLVQSATLPTNGFVVINGTSGGSERVIGSSYLLNAGLADNVRIQLNQPVNGSESLTAVLYADSNGNGAFDADADEPVYQGDSDRRVVDIAEVSVQGSSSGTATSSGSAGTAAATETAASASGAETTAASGDGGASTDAASGNASGGNASGESTSSNGPGFGPVVGVVALLAVALLARRH